MKREIFRNISPLDHRYSLRRGEREGYEEYLSEEAIISAQLQVEVSLVKILAKRGICPEEVVREVEKACKEIEASEVYKEEEKTRHNIRALVNCICRRIPVEYCPFIHFTATSMDIVDTSYALLFKKANRELLLPAIRRLLCQWMRIAKEERETLQIGRTHGQKALPITFGLSMAWYVQRLGERMERLQVTGDNLRGKMAGAVGAYNGTSLFFEDPQSFEREVMEDLGLEASPISTQIVAPEYLLDYIHALISTFGVLANFSDDMRHLQRTEIGEVGEYFAPEQVGSSTMPHKRNPINYEHVKSLWKEFMPRMVTHYMDQISEHQRDLTNSASSRFVIEILVGLLLSINRLERVSLTFSVDRVAMERNLKDTEGLIMAEALYLLLSSCGHPKAHEEVRLLTLEAEEKKKSLHTLLWEKKELKSYAEKLGDRLEILTHPEEYIGLARERVDSIVSFWEERLKKGEVIDEEE